MKKQTIYAALAILCLLGTSCRSSRQQAYYDERPENIKPILVHKASDNYNIEDDKTFAAYKNPYTVSQPEGKFYGQGHGYYQLYRNKDATYLTITFFCPEDAWFFHVGSGECIIDRETGDRYMLREMEFYPTDTCFWIKGAAGKYVRFVQKYPPLPLSVKEIEFFSPSAPSRYNFDGSAWKASARVEDLRLKTRTGKIIY